MDLNQGTKEQRADLWIPCSSAATWCAPYRDRVSTSLVSADLPLLYGNGEGAGLLIDVGADAVFCSYPNDGGTLEKTCDIDDEDYLNVNTTDFELCLPGCSFGGHVTWCNGGGFGSFDCAYRSTETAAMLRHHRVHKTSYNEVVINVAQFASQLPHSVAAVFVTRGASSSLRMLARQVHAAFYAAYPSLEVGEVPLVVLDVHNREHPVQQQPGLTL